MSFFKKIFGGGSKTQNSSDKINSLLEPFKQVPWMTAARLETITICLENGFRPSTSLPTEFDKQIRPALEIAQRLHAIKALVLWLMVPEEDLSDEKILNYVAQNQLEQLMTEDEKIILSIPRDDEDARNMIGWKFENAWPLVWYFGYQEPSILGNMMTGEQMQDILMNYTCRLDENLEEWVQSKPTISEELLIKKEDLFYCLHNAVRSAQLGSDTVPKNFDPIGNGGVIHERRHALTWMLSKGIDWDETDLST
jgi:hypothetical protein